MCLSSARFEGSLKAPPYSLTPLKDVLKSLHAICCLSQTHQADGRDRWGDKEGDLSGAGLQNTTTGETHFPLQLTPDKGSAPCGTGSPRGLHEKG